MRQYHAVSEAEGNGTMTESQRDVLLCRIVWGGIFAFSCLAICGLGYLMATRDGCLAAGVAAFLALTAWAVRTR